MKARGILCFLSMLAAAGGTCHARLGESPSAMEGRYGAPIASAPLPNFTESMYGKDGFAITVYYQNGVSVMESFASRGMDQTTARKVVYLVANHPVGSPDSDEEAQLREASGITCKDEIFWMWTAGGMPVKAAFNPMECTLAFFSDPAVYAGVQKALLSAPPLGF
jgi:hypothetical protein